MLWSYCYKKRWLLIPLGIYLALILLNAIGLKVWLPSCIIHSTTGIECMGCGSTSAMIALLQGKWHLAMEHNPLIFLYILIGLALFILDYRKHQLTSHHGQI